MVISACRFASEVVVLIESCTILAGETCHCLDHHLQQALGKHNISCPQGGVAEAGCSTSVRIKSGGFD